MVGETGRIFTLKATDLRMLPSRNQQITFPVTSRTWVAQVYLGQGLVERCLDVDRREVLPHRVSWDEDFNVITVEWTYPIAGYLLLG